MAVNLRKPPKRSVRYWNFPRKVADEIIREEGWIAYNMLCNIMQDKSARMEMRNLLEAREVFYKHDSFDNFLDHFEEAVRETISGWFHGEICYSRHDDLLLGIIDDLFENNEYRETARAIIYLLDNHYEESDE